MTARFWLGVFLLGGMVSLLRAQGGPPMFTDDPGTVPAGHWEINTAWVHEQRTGASDSELPLLDMNYGLTAHAHVKYEVSWLDSAETAGGHRQGLSNSSVGVKWRFLDEEQAGVAISTYPQFEFRNPGSGSARRGLVEDENSLLLPLQFQKDLGAVSLNADAGRVFNSRGADGWIYGLAAGREVNQSLELALEIHAESTGHLAADRLVLNAGARVHCSEHGTLLISVGREMRNRDEPRASCVSYVGWQLSL